MWCCSFKKKSKTQSTATTQTDRNPVVEKMPVIGCIAQTIIDDLNTLPVDNWKIESEHHAGVYIPSTYTFSNPAVSYRFFYYFRAIGNAYVGLRGLNHSPFNEDEMKAIHDAILSFDDKKRAIKIEKEKAEDKLKLKEMFPTCFQ